MAAGSWSLSAILTVVCLRYRSRPWWLMVSTECGTAEMPGAVFLPESGKPALSCAAAAASVPFTRDEAIYDRHAPGLYRQALLTLGDTSLAEQVVSDVILGECLRSAPRGGDEPPQSCAWGYGLPALPGSGRRPGLAKQALRPEAAGERPGLHRACRVEREGTGSARAGDFRPAGYVQAAGELAITPADMAALLRAVLSRLASAGAPA